MKIKKDKIQLSESQEIPWENVETLRALNDKLVFVLDDHQVIELQHLNPHLVDSAFRAYESYIRQNPEKKKPRPRR